MIKQSMIAGMANAHIRTVKTTALWLLLGELVEKATAFWILTLCALLYGAAQFGEFNFLIAATSTGFLFFDFGLSLYVVKEIATDRKRAQRVFQETVVHKMLGIVVAISIAFVLAYVLFRAQIWTIELIWVYGAVVFYNAAVNIQQYLVSFLRGIEKTRTEFVYRGVYIALSFLLGFGMVYAVVPFRYVVCGLALIQILYIVFLYHQLCVMNIARRITSSDLRRDLNPVQWKIFIRRVAPYALSGIFVYIYFKADVMIVRSVRGAVEAGLYSAPYTILTAAYLLPAMFSSAILPRISLLINEKQGDQFTSVSRDAVRLSALVGGLTTVGVMVLAPSIVRSFFGYEYVESIRILQILSLAIVCKFIAHMYAAVLTAHNAQSTRTRIQGAIAAINIVCNSIAIPLYGMYAAAAITVFSEALLLFLYMRAARTVAAQRMAAV